MDENQTPVVITKYTALDIKKVFFQYQNACKSKQDAQLMKKCCAHIIQVLGLQEGKTYSSIAHKE